VTSAYFVTGTDTGVGKTHVAAALLHLAGHRGLRTAAIKPVAAGCQTTAAGLRNDDALILQAASSLSLAYEQVNPVALAPAVAPHLAASEAGLSLAVDSLARHCRGVLALGADLTLVEGAGGWRVPLNDRETLADLAAALGLPVIMVVAMRLGCINHAILTAEAIRRDGLILAGWVANSVDVAMPLRRENLQTLVQRLGAPLLGDIPFQPTASPVDMGRYLDLPSAMLLKRQTPRG